MYKQIKELLFGMEIGDVKVIPRPAKIESFRAILFRLSREQNMTIISKSVGDTIRIARVKQYKTRTILNN